MIMFRKFILAMVLLVLGSVQVLARQPIYVAKIPVPKGSGMIDVPIFSAFLQNEGIWGEDAAHRLEWGMRMTLASSNPLQYQKLGLHIAQIKHELQGHVQVFDDDLLIERMDSAAKVGINYEQLAAVQADIVRSLQQSSEFQQAYGLKEEDMLAVEDSLSVLRDDYIQQLNREAASNLKLISRLVQARLDAVQRVSVKFGAVNDLSQKFVVLDIAQENAEFGSFLALRFALLHHLYQQQIALHPPLPSHQADGTAQPIEHYSDTELQFHQAREEFHRALYLLLQQDKSGS